MHLSNATLNGFWHARLEAARQYARLNLESAGQFLQAQARYLAGIGQLGQEHRLIAKMVDRISACHGPEADAESASEAMSTVGHLIREHFNAEESLLAELGAPAEEVTAHQEDHTRLIHEYVDLPMLSINGRPVPAARMGSFLQGWLAEHALKHDLRFRDYLADQQRGRNGHPQ